jgi:hypothetical protein
MGGCRAGCVFFRIVGGGKDSHPPADHYQTVCKIEADTSRLTKYPTRRRGVPNSTFFELKFDVILSFGLTELKAQIAWLENVRHLGWIRLGEMLTIHRVSRRGEFQIATCALLLTMVQRPSPNSVLNDSFWFRISPVSYLKYTRIYSAVLSHLGLPARRRVRARGGNVRNAVQASLR